MSNPESYRKGPDDSDFADPDHPKPAESSTRATATVEPHDSDDKQLEITKETANGLHGAINRNALKAREKRKGKKDGIIRSNTPRKMTPPDGTRAHYGIELAQPDSPGILAQVERKAAIPVSEMDPVDNPNRFKEEINPTQQLPELLEEAHAKIYMAGHTYVDVQPLSDKMEVGLRRFLYKHLNSATAVRIKLVQCLMRQQKFFLDQGILREPITDTESYYEASALFKTFLAGRIVMETMALNAGFPTVKDFLFDKDNNPSRIMSIGPADGDAVRGIHKVRKALKSLAEFQHLIDAPSPIRKRSAREAMAKVTGEQIMTREFYADEDLITVDITKAFPEILWCEKNIQAISADASDPNLVGMHKVGKKRPEQRVDRPKQTLELEEGTIDQFMAYNVLDRVQDHHEVYRNIKKLAKPGARFQFALPVHITNINTVGDTITHWDPSRDKRALWMSPDETDAIFYMFLDFRMSGLIVDRLSMQPYASLNPECIVDFADKLRTIGKQELEKRLAKKDGTLARQHMQILANLFGEDYPEYDIRPSFVFQDSDLVLFPEIYDLVFFSGYVDKDYPTAT